MTSRSHRCLSAVAGLALLVPLIGACGGSDTPPAPTAEASAAAAEPAASEPAASEPAASEPAPEEPAVAEGIPDPCEMLPSEQLASLTGSDVGAGTSSGDEAAVMRTCIYPSGLVITIVRGTQFESSVKVMRSDPNLEEIADVSGLGEQAVIGTYVGGAVRQVMALQGGSFVTVTGALSEAQATATAQALLDAR